MGASCDEAKRYRCGGTRYALHIVVFGHPKSGITKALRELRKL
jgi:hypothetical protein